MNESNKGDPIGRFFAGAIVAVGALIFGLCGLCTLTFLVAGMIPHGDRSFSIVALVVGGIPTALGFMLLRFGISMYREESNRVRPDAEGPS